MQVRSFMRRIVIGLGAVLAALGAAADEPASGSRADFDAPSLSSRWRIVVGGAFSTFGSRAAWAPSGLTGATIELEDTLGLDEGIETWMVAGSYRFNQRHSIQLRATDLGRSATRVVEDEIEWGDVIYRANARIDSRLGFTALDARWRYDFSDSGRLNSGVSLGLSMFRVSLKLKGEGRLDSDDGTEWIDGVVEEANVVAPVPEVGFFIDYAMTPKWILRVEANAMSLDVGEYRGRVVDTGAGIEYQVSRSVGVGLAVATTDIEYRQEKEGEKLGVDFRVSSVDLHASFSF